MSNTGPIIADRLKSFIARAERLIEERKAIQADITDIFLEAKGVGHDVKTIRKVIALRAMDPADRLEQECLLDTYLHALGMVDRVEVRLDAGQSTREIAAAEGTSKSTVGRVSQKRASKPNVENGTAAAKVDVITPAEAADLPSHDRETGEIAARQSDLETVDGTPPGDDERTGLGPAPASVVAKQLRDQIPASTDPDRLERLAADVEGDGLDIPSYLKRQPQVAA